jgi:hypothetical protein
MLALVFLLFRPQGCSAKRSSSGYELRAESGTMFYREAGQFKTSYAPTRRSSRSARIAWRLLLIARARLACPCPGQQLLARDHLMPFLIFSLAALGLNILTGYAASCRSAPAASWPAAPSSPTSSRPPFRT